MANLIGANFQMAEEVNIKGYKEEILVEKGVIITEDHAIKMESLYQKYCEFFTAYPDLFLDLIKPADSNFQLFFYQRIFLRACAQSILKDIRFYSCDHIEVCVPTWN